MSDYKKYTFAQKRKYYSSRLGLFNDGKRYYARGFVDGSGPNYTKRHYVDDKKELQYSWSEYKKQKSPDDKKIWMDSICGIKGRMHGYEEKMKEYKKK